MARQSEPPVIRGMKKLRQFFDDASASTILRWEKDGLPLYRNPHVMGIREEMLAWVRARKRREKKQGK